MALAILTIACGKKESDAATESNTLTAFVYLNLTYKIEGDKITITGCNKKIADTLISRSLNTLRHSILKNIEALEKT